MISAETLVALETRDERTDKIVRELVLDDATPFVPLLFVPRVIGKRGKQVDYEAKRRDAGGQALAADQPPS